MEGLSPLDGHAGLHEYITAVVASRLVISDQVMLQFCSCFDHDGHSPNVVSVVSST